MRPSVQRVTRQYLRRCAGILDYPPRMKADIWVWLREQYASYVLWETEKVLPLLMNRDKTIRENLEKNKKALADFKSHVGELGISASLTYLVYGARVTKIGVMKSLYEEGPFYILGWGDPKHPFRWDWDAKGDADWAVKRLTRWIENSSKELIASGKEPLRDSALVNLLALKQECLKYVPAPNKAAQSKKRKIFPVDLTGWKYLAQFPDWQKNPDVAEAEISVIFSPKHHASYTGRWWGDGMVLEVDASADKPPLNVKDFRVTLGRMEETLEHELRHLSQTVLSHLSGKSMAGLPADSTSDSEKRPEHALRDVEFYTHIGGEVKDFINFARKIPRSAWALALREWVGVDVEWPKDTPTEVMSAPYRDFFRLLKSKKPDRWRKAVAEFTKAVEARIDIPRAS